MSPGSTITPPPRPSLPRHLSPPSPRSTLAPSSAHSPTGPPPCTTSRYCASHEYHTPPPRAHHGPTVHRPRRTTSGHAHP
ncbi:hypothetical protein DWU95_30150, partial [Burkholderia contaminans]